MYVGVPVGVCTCGMLVWVHVWVYYECVLIPFLSVCLAACSAFWIHSVRSGPVAGDLDPIQICARYRPNTLAIRRLIHGMICRSVLARAVKTRRRFGSKTTSFHLSVCFCLIFSFTVINMYLFYFYHFMWLSVIFYQFDYLYHFMRHLWLFTLIT